MGSVGAGPHPTHLSRTRLELLAPRPLEAPPALVAPAPSEASALAPPGSKVGAAICSGGGAAAAAAAAASVSWSWSMRQSSVKRLELHSRLSSS